MFFFFPRQNIFQLSHLNTHKIHSKQNKTKKPIKCTSLSNNYVILESCNHLDTTPPPTLQENPITFQFHYFNACELSELKRSPADHVNSKILLLILSFCCCSRNHLLLLINTSDNLQHCVHDLIHILIQTLVSTVNCQFHYPTISMKAMDSTEIQMHVGKSQ